MCSWHFLKVGSENDFVTQAALTTQATWTEHENWLRTVIACRLRSSDAVEDVLQEVGLCWTRQSLRDEEIHSVPGWLYRVALRQVISYRRRAGRARKYLATSSEEGITSAAVIACPMEAMLAAEQTELFETAFAKLTSQDRQILLLKHQHGWSYGQLAKSLGVSVHTIEYRLLKARKNLRKFLTTQSGSYRDDN